MSCIVYQTDKRTGIKYAYESTSYWDKEKKQPKSKRKYLGRVDTETGEIVTSRRKKKSIANDELIEGNADSLLIAQLQAQTAEKDSRIALLQNELETLTARYQKAEKLIEALASSAAEFMEETNV